MVHSTQEDPIGLAGGLNLYNYGSGDPVNNWDPFGLCTDSRGNTVECPDKAKIARWLQDSAGTKSSGQCAKYCRKGFEAGGLDTRGRPDSAYEYGAWLEQRGAGIVPAQGYEPEVGDIMVYGRNAHHPAGHIQVYTPDGWISDFKQKSENPYAKPETAGAKAVYRFPGTLPAMRITPDE